MPIKFAEIQTKEIFYIFIKEKISPKQSVRAYSGRFYKDRKIKDFEEKLRWLFYQERKVPIVSSVVKCDVFVHVASNSSTKFGLEKWGKIFTYARKPDEDNLKKMLYDSIKNVIIGDDCQIVDSRYQKIFSYTDGVEISVQVIDAEAVK